MDLRLAATLAFLLLLPVLLGVGTWLLTEEVRVSAEELAALPSFEDVLAEGRARRATVPGATLAFPAWVALVERELANEDRREDRRPLGGPVPVADWAGDAWSFPHARHGERPGLL